MTTTLYRSTTATTGGPCADLAAGYRALTGQEPLHGHRDRCGV